MRWKNSSKNKVSLPSNPSPEKIRLSPEPDFIMEHVMASTPIPESAPHNPEKEHPLDYEPARFDRIVVSIGNVIACGYFITVFITLYEVVMRYIFDAPTSWVYETSIMLVGSAMLYGGAYCMSNNGHIRVTVITDQMPLTVQRIIRTFDALLTLCFMLSLCYAAWFMLYNAVITPDDKIRLERTGSAFNSIMPAEIKFTLFLIVCLMLVQSILQFIQSIRQIAGGKRR